MQFNIYIYIIFLLSPCSLIFLCLFNLIALYPFYLIHINSFNWVRQNIHLILGTGSSHGIRKIRAWERIIKNEEGFDIGRDVTVFLASVLDKTEYTSQNDEGEGAAEAHAEVIDQSIRKLRSIRDFILCLTRN